jgi:hypothetical protein
MIYPNSISNGSKMGNPELESIPKRQGVNDENISCSSFFRCVFKPKQLEYMDNFWLPGMLLS